VFILDKPGILAQNVRLFERAWVGRKQQGRGELGIRAKKKPATGG